MEDVDNYITETGESEHDLANEEIGEIDKQLLRLTEENMYPRFKCNDEGREK